MEVVRHVVLCCICMVSFAPKCEADGFFRRLPEVGEWARYEFVMEVDATAQEELDLHQGEFAGSLTLKCVGDEMIDEVEHLWLEARIDLTDVEGADGWVTVKLLVPADQVVDGKINANIVRGWCVAAFEEPRPLILSDDDFIREPSALNMMNAFPDSHISAGRRAVRTLTVDGEEIPLAHCETGDLPQRDFLDTVLVGEATWWPSADHAFGIAAAELEWSSASTDLKEPYRFTSRMSLVEYGVDAESDLPEHN